MSRGSESIAAVRLSGSRVTRIIVSERAGVRAAFSSGRWSMPSSRIVTRSVPSQVGSGSSVSGVAVAVGHASAAVGVAVGGGRTGAARGSGTVTVTSRTRTTGGGGGRTPRSSASTVRTKSQPERRPPPTQSPKTKAARLIAHWGGRGAGSGRVAELLGRVAARRHLTLSPRSETRAPTRLSRAGLRRRMLRSSRGGGAGRGRRRRRARPGPPATDAREEEKAMAATVGYAVVGAGLVGPTHARFASQATGCQLKVVCD